MIATLDVVTAVLIVAGSLLALTAAVGLARFPDTVSRMHPGTKAQVLGLILVLTGAGIQLRDSVDVGMLVLAALFSVITAPVFAQLVGRLAYQEGRIRPELVSVDEIGYLDGSDDESSGDDPGADGPADDATDEGPDHDRPGRDETL